MTSAVLGLKLVCGEPRVKSSTTPVPPEFRYLPPNWFRARLRAGCPRPSSLSACATSQSAIARLEADNIADTNTLLRYAEPPDAIHLRLRPLK